MIAHDQQLVPTTPTQILLLMLVSNKNIYIDIKPYFAFGIDRY